MTTSPRYIYLIRHGKAQAEGKGTASDPQRALTPVGHQQAKQVAKALRHANPPVTALYTSPATRCVQTAQPIAHKLGLSIHTEPRLGRQYHADASLPYLRPQRGAAVIVGHHEQIPDLVHALTGHDLDDYPYGGVICLERTGPESARILWHAGPDDAKDYCKGEYMSKKASEPLQFAATGAGHWVTLGGDEENEGENGGHGGVHVFIQNGTITKGPRSLVGGKIAHLSDHKQTHHPEGHEPAGARSHPNYHEHERPKPARGKPYARERGAPQTRQEQGPEPLSEEETRAGLATARNEAKQADYSAKVDAALARLGASRLTPEQIQKQKEREAPTGGPIHVMPEPQPKAELPTSWRKQSKTKAGLAQARAEVTPKAESKPDTNALWAQHSALVAEMYRHRQEADSQRSRGKPGLARQAEKRADDAESRMQDVVRQLDAAIGMDSAATPTPAAVVTPASGPTLKPTGEGEPAKPKSEYEEFLKKHEAARAEAKADMDKRNARASEHGSILRSPDNEQQYVLDHPKAIATAQRLGMKVDGEAFDPSKHHTAQLYNAKNKELGHVGVLSKKYVSDFAAQHGFTSLSHSNASAGLRNAIANNRAEDMDALHARRDKEAKDALAAQHAKVKDLFERGITTTAYDIQHREERDKLLDMERAVYGNDKNAVPDEERDAPYRKPLYDARIQRLRDKEAADKERYEKEIAPRLEAERAAAQKAQAEWEAQRVKPLRSDRPEGLTTRDDTGPFSNGKPADYLNSMEQSERLATARDKKTPADVLHELAGWGKDEGKAVAANPNTSADTLHGLATEPGYYHEKAWPAIAKHANAAPETLDYLARRGDAKVQGQVAANPNAHADTMHYLSDEQGHVPEVRLGFAKNPRTSAEQLDKMRTDFGRKGDSGDYYAALASHPNLSEAGQTNLAYDGPLPALTALAKRPQLAERARELLMQPPGKEVSGGVYGNKQPHEDVLKALVANPATPMKHVYNMRNHRNPDIANAAQKRIEDYAKPKKAGEPMRKIPYLLPDQSQQFDGQPAAGDVHINTAIGNGGKRNNRMLRHLTKAMRAHFLEHPAMDADTFEQHVRRAKSHAGGMTRAHGYAEWDPVTMGTYQVTQVYAERPDDWKSCKACKKGKESKCTCPGCKAGKACWCCHGKHEQQAHTEGHAHLYSESGEAFRVFMPFAAAEAPDWMPLLPKPGTFSHPRWGKITITPQRNQEFISNFKAGVYQKHIPIDAEHQTKLSGAMGYIADMRLNEDGSADARMDWTPRGRTLLGQDAFKYVSPEFYEEWTAPDTGVTHKNVLIGGALTTRPFFKESALRPLVAAEDGIYVDDESTPYRPDGQEFTDMSKTNTEDTQTFAEQIADLEARLAESLKANEEVATQAKTATEQLATMHAQNRHRAFAEQASGWLGRSADQHATFMERLPDDDMRSEYAQTMRALSEQLKDSKLFVPIGRSGGADDGTPQGKVDALAKARAKEKGISEAQAYTEVLTENPSLYDQGDFSLGAQLAR